MKSCMKRCSSQSDMCMARSPSPSLDRRLSGDSQRKCVSFCSEDAEIFYVDDWDRSPAEVTDKLHYRCVICALKTFWNSCNSESFYRGSTLRIARRKSM
ncbi:hypothetical protein OBBRIDRAFT_787453 [Obba rivulosa]|uniref:Uncharacterized protein n=1 Tax=Obba rivulosa TaxID=1052685 RepID=A0A8E2DVM5_9APHY|nr:hypothetical protein OBBRIDRAFT_787453 [Obba rivulosa]